MTARSYVAMSGTLAEHHTEHRPTAKLPAIASRLAALRLAWECWVAHRRLAQSIAHLDDRMLADIGLRPEDLPIAERIARRRAVGFGIWQ